MDEPVLRAQDVTVCYPGSPTPAVRHAELEVFAAAAIGIVGESGSGKTTLGRALVGALAPSSGRVEVQGRAWSNIARRDPLRRTVQMIFQDPYASLNPTLTAHQTVAEVCRAVARLPRAAAARQAAAILSEVGLTGDVIHRRPRGLSGGQRQRVGIARALACNPSVLVADEPTSALDASVQAHVLNLLLDLRESRGLALVLISHDLAVIDYMTTEALVMYRGRVIERGRTGDLLTEPRHPYTQALVDAIPGGANPLRLTRNSIDAPEGCVFASRCPELMPDCLEQQPDLVQSGSLSTACHHPLMYSGSHEHDRPGAKLRS